MAFAITNKTFANPEGSYNPAAHKELADLTMSSSTIGSGTINTGIVGLKWIRVRVYLKTLGGIAAGETVVVTVQAGTGAAITGPEQIAHKSITMLVNDLTMCFDVLGYSQAGFQSYAVTVSSSGSSRTGVADVMIDAA